MLLRKLKLAAGTISAAVSLTAPTLVITNGTFTMNVDNTNYLKLFDSNAGHFLSLQAGPNLSNPAYGTFSGVMAKNSAGNVISLQTANASDVEVSCYNASTGANAKMNTGGVVVNDAFGRSAILIATALDLGASQVLTTRQTGPGTASGWADSTAQSWANNLLTALRTHGLVT